MKPIDVLKSVDDALSQRLPSQASDDLRSRIRQAIAAVAPEQYARVLETYQRYVDVSNSCLTTLNVLLTSIRRRDKIAALRQMRTVNDWNDQRKQVMVDLRSIDDGFDVAVFAEDDHRLERLIDQCQAELDSLLGRVRAIQPSRHVQIIRTPTGQLSMIRPVAEKLLAEGVISGSLDGELHAADAATVKAAMMAAGICDFCSAPGATHVFDVPDFEMPGGLGTSIEGWAACDECAALVRADKKRQLLDRALEKMAFSKFTRPAIEELHRRFWAGMNAQIEAAGEAAAITDYVEGRLAPSQVPYQKTGRDKRIDAISDLYNLTRAEVLELMSGRLTPALVAKLKGARERIGGDLTRVRSAVEKLVTDTPRPPLTQVVPHWQRALDARFEALASLSAFAKKQRDVVFPEATDLKDPAAIRDLAQRAEAARTWQDMAFGEDVKYLRAAQTYSFNAETIAAIREAARSIPRDAPLSSIEAPNTGAGWFWFSEPLPVVASSLASDRVAALLWGWTNGERTVRTLAFSSDVLSRLSHEDRERLDAIASKQPNRLILSSDIPEARRIIQAAGITQDEFDRITRPEQIAEPAIVFSAYVLDARDRVTHVPTPSTRWAWPFSSTFDEMLVITGQAWDESHGHGAPYEHGPWMTREASLRAVGELSLFFMMACVWFRQTVPGTQRKVEPKLTRGDGHVERHARKRYAREHKLDEPPRVQVVALRKTARVDAEEAPAERRAGAREYSCRWIVAGHARMQACGPGRKDRKLIWIDAHPAGPEDKPLKTKEKVYAVVR